MAITDISDNEWVLELEDLEKDSAKLIQILTKKEREIKGVRHKFNKGDVLYSKLRTYLNKVLVAPNNGYCSTEIIPFNSYCNISTNYLAYVLRSVYFLNYTQRCGYGVKMPRLSTNDACRGLIPLPPVEEQKRIVDKIKCIYSIIDLIEKDTSYLYSSIKTLKSKILELAMQGKLVPQDPTDEPAAEMLKRINPNAKILTDFQHYPQLPSNWALIRLEEITDYEQPQRYIVRNTDYSDTYATPVLTAGKSFILGYTNELNGIYDKVPAIIFDDFTTDSHLVDFPFKVKSSAMKIIRVNNNLNIEYVAMFMSMTRLIGDTHKRYWISEYSKIPIPIPPIKEQNRIVDKVKSLYHELDTINDLLTNT